MSVLVQQEKTLAQCCLWDYQKSFFADEGINAWAGQVPFYVTSNPHIANIYANIVIRLMQDYKSNDLYDPAQPFYLLELGTGSGKFSFYLIKRLIELQTELKLQDLNFTYIMSDFTTSNISFWQQHPEFQKYIQQGQLDFATYDLTKTTSIKLLHSKQTLSKSKITNPLIVFANYIFDTVNHDAFRISEHKLQLGKVKITTDQTNITNKKVTDLTQLTTNFDYHDIPTTYYADSTTNKILDQYQHQFANTNFLVPTGALTCIKNLLALSNNNLFVITTDKGYATKTELQQQAEPHIAFHGSFSLMVNFHAIGEYFKLQGGNAYCQSDRQSIKTAVFSLGSDIDTLTETKHAISNYIHNLCPADLFNMHTQMKYSEPVDGLETLLSHMNLTRWDPHIFSLYLDYILGQIQWTDNATLQGLIQGCNKIANNFYYLPKNTDTMFELGLFFHSIGDHQTALRYYQQSIKYFGAQDYVLEHCAECQRVLN